MISKLTRLAKERRQDLTRFLKFCVVGIIGTAIDFGIFNSANDYNADFINGYNRDEILLDFNVDGVIWDII